MKGKIRKRQKQLVYLSHLLDLGASLPDEGATLAGWHHQAQGHRGLAGGRAVAHGIDYILQNEEMFLIKQCEICDTVSK